MASREASPAPSSAGDTVDETADDSKLVLADHDDIPSDVPTRTDTPSSARGIKRARGSGARKPRPRKGQHVWVSERLENATEDESPAVKVKQSSTPDPEVKLQATTVGTRRQANGTVGSVYSGSKIRHIKKPDGEPLWRREIQYLFLHQVVTNKEAVFTRMSDKQKNCTFADIYVDCMARSSKTSKILKDRLYVDRPAAENMAMICLLVNVGRMNTTLNFFPEMRAQLRTYHPIPALQAYPNQKDYKSLQDAPRLKSILKGASEDTDEPRNLPQLRALSVPRTNPVNLIFVLSQAANEISQVHFTDKVDFFDLAIRPTISSASRARAFLWLMWWYLESDFSKDAALNNPFGPGEYKPDQDPADPKQLPLLVPKLDQISEEDGAAENKDPEDEISFGNKMTKERELINEKFAEQDAANEQAGVEHKGVKRLKRTAREFADDSDVDSLRASPGLLSTRSPAPADTPVPGPFQADSLEDDWEPMDAHPGRGRYKRVRGKNTPSRSKMRASDATGTLRSGRGGSRLGLASDRGTPDTHQDTPAPLPPGSSNHPTLSQYSGYKSRDYDLASSGAGHSHSAYPTKSRARTGYQRELEEHRQRRIDWLVKKKRRGALKHARSLREQSSWLFKAAQRISRLDDMYDSEEDDEASKGTTSYFNADLAIFRGTGLGGIIPRKSEVTVNPVRTNSNGTEPEAAEAKPHIIGEEVDHWYRILQRTQRRLDTWSADRDLDALQLKRDRAAGRLATAASNNAISSKASRHASAVILPLDGSGSVTDATPRKGHTGKKSLDDEITQDLLAERSNDEDDDGYDEDVAMADGDADGSDVEMD